MRVALVAAAAAVVLLVSGAQSADTFAVRLVSQTSTTVTLGWDPQPGFGYLFSYDCDANGVCTLVSRTNDPSRSTVKFQKGHDGYQVAVITKGGTGSYYTAPPVTDTQPPSTPQGQITSVTVSSITLDWNPSTDNVGVDHYNVFLGGAKVTQTLSSVTVYTFAGLSCGTNYTLGLQAADLAGNVSPLAEATWTPVKTSDCVTPPPPSGNATSAVATNGNDSTCVRGDLTKPCLTLNRAYQISQCGDTVEVRAGTYANQQVNEVGSLSGCQADVVFEPVSGTTVTIPLLYLGSCCGLSGTATNAPDHVTFRGFTLPDGFAIDGDANNVTLDRIDGGSFFIGGGNNIMVSNGDYGPCWSSGSGPTCDSHFRQIVLDGPFNGLTLQGNTIHDYILNPGSADHFECIRVGSGQNVTYRGNRFFNCEIYGSTLTYLTGTTLIENNWFQSSCFGFPPTCPRGSALVNMGDVRGTLIVRFNSFGPGEAIADEGSPSGGQANRFVVGNIFGRATCLTGHATYSYNVFFGTGGATCGSNATYIGANAPYVNAGWAATGDYHLSVTTAADNYVPTGVPNSGAATDYDGQARPMGAARDAGADER